MVELLDSMPALIVISAVVAVVLEAWRRQLAGRMPRLGHAIALLGAACALVAPFVYRMPIDAAALAARSAPPAEAAAQVAAAQAAGLEHLAAAGAVIVGALLVLARASARARRGALAPARLVR